MSYILDALKKSETNRARNIVLDTQSVQLHPSIPENRRVPWPILLIIAFGLGIGGFIAWKYAMQKQASGIDQSLAKVESTDSSTLTTAFASKNRVTPNLKINEVQPDVGPQTKQKSRPRLPSKQKSAVKKAPLPPNVIFSETPLDVPGFDNNSEYTRPGKVVMSKSILDKVSNISDLPLGLRNRIPNISFDGHVYSGTPAQRSVMLNGRKMREGEIVSSNLSLEKITERGAEFKFDGYRFKLGALQDWSQ